MLIRKDGNTEGLGRKGVVKLLSSMQTGLFLLIILVGTCSIGGLVPQGEVESFYREFYGELLGNVILLFSFDKMYTARWFIVLCIFFMANILICSFNRIKGFKNFRDAGSILLHLSILVVFAGAMVSGMAGKKEYIELGVGDSVNLYDHGFSTSTLKVKDFNIKFYDNLEPRQYISTLSLTASSGKETIRNVSVNHPLKTDGIKIYQKSYGWVVKGSIKYNGKNMPFELKSGEELPINREKGTKIKTIFIPDFNPFSASLHSQTPLPKNPYLACALIQGEQLIDVLAIPNGQDKELHGYLVTFSGYRYYTGLEIKKDPGVPVVYAGFIIMVLGLVIRYLAPDKKGGTSEVTVSGGG